MTRIEILKYNFDGEDEIVKVIGPVEDSRADKVEDGVNINLNHAEYWTRQVTEPS
jgi:hypothetical protein